MKTFFLEIQKPLPRDSQWLPINQSFDALDSLIHLDVIQRSLNTPPGSPANGDRYHLGASPTGAWSGQAGKIAVRRSGAWDYYTPKEGWLLTSQADAGTIYKYQSGAFAAIAGVGASNLDSLSDVVITSAASGHIVEYNGSNFVNVFPKVELVIAASDESTAITTGTAKVTFRMPFAMTLTAVRASLSTAQASGSIFTVDVNETGSSILSTKLTIDNTEKTSTTAATAAVISDSALADDAEITVDVDQVGDGTGKGLKVTLIGRRMSSVLINSALLGAGGGGGGYTPPTITSASYKNWAEARHETGLSDADPVGTFTDQSGLGNHWTQSTSGKKPLYKTNILNGQPILRFDGSDDYLSLSSDILSGATSGEVFLVVKVDNDPPASNLQSGLWNMDNNGDACHYPYTNSDVYEAWGSDTRRNLGNPSPSLANWRLYNVSSGSSFTVRLDGTQIFTVVSNTFQSFNGNRYLGRSETGGTDLYFDGDIAGIVIVNAVLNSTDRDTIENELATAYGLTVA